MKSTVLRLTVALLLVDKLSAFEARSLKPAFQTFLFTATPQFSNVADIAVTTLDGESVLLGDIISSEERPTILSCLSHFGDFNAWELTQKYQVVDTAANIVLVGIGSSNAAQKFANDLNLDASQITLVSDETGAVTDALGCYRGWLAVDRAHAEKWPATDVNPYVKLFGMIFGFGSPGTISKVLYGYIGDSDGGVASRRWVVESLLQGSRKGRWPQLKEEAFEGIDVESGLRPFELATLRAQTGIHIVLNWSRLGPEDGDLFTRMGGTFVFDKQGECVYEYFDQGILTYADVQEVCKVAEENIAKPTIAMEIN